MANKIISHSPSGYLMVLSETIYKTCCFSPSSCIMHFWLKRTRKPEWDTVCMLSCCHVLWHKQRRTEIGRCECAHYQLTDFCFWFRLGQRPQRGREEGRRAQTPGKSFVWSPRKRCVGSPSHSSTESYMSPLKGNDALFWDFFTEIGRVAWPSEERWHTERKCCNDGQWDGGVPLRAGARLVLVRAVVRGLVAHHPHLLGVAGPEDRSPEAPGLPLGVRLALRRLLRLRGVEGFSLQLARLHRPGGDIQFRQQQLLLLDRGHRGLPLRFYREVEPTSRRQPGAVFPLSQVRQRLPPL